MSNLKREINNLEDSISMDKAHLQKQQMILKQRISSIPILAIGISISVLFGYCIERGKIREFSTYIKKASPILFSFYRSCKTIFALLSI